MVRRSWFKLAAIAGAMGLAAIASASESRNRGYDANVRLVEIERSGSTNNGVNAGYRYDKADNRTNVNVTGSPNPPP